MIVLGFDTAGASTAVALRLSDGSTRERRDDPPAGTHPGHATRLLAMAGELLAEAASGWREIDRIAVGVGPGAFTGLRVGVATARGLAQSLEVELAAVSSLAALAAGAAGTSAAGEPLLAVIDARRGEVFAAAYLAEQQDSEPVALTEPRALAPELLGDMAREVERAHGGAPPQAFGDGALRYREQLERAGVPVPDGEQRLHRVGAATVCALGARASAAARLEDILPDYRREPDAELALEAAAQGGGAR